ncbi:MAG: hypothetical protein ACJ71Q_10465 [Terriglobales bacterium]|jgi:hypothetical protein
MQPSLTRESIPAKLPRIIFYAFLLALSVLAYFVPYYDWDLVAYTGSAIALYERDPIRIQKQAYAALQQELPQDDYVEIVSGSEFRSDVSQDAEHFRQQLRFYQIRPMYIRLLAGLHGAGLAYVNATRVISAVAFTLLGILLFVWARSYVGEWQAAICVPLLLITPALFGSARIGSPDELSAFVLLLGTFELIERERMLLGTALLFTSLLLRTDNVIFVFLLLASVAAVNARARLRVWAAVFAVASVAIVLTINHVEHSYGWSVLMQNTVTPIVNPAEVSSTVAAADYVGAVHDMVDEARESSVLVFPFLAGIALLSSRTAAELKRLVGVGLLSWIAHLALFPHIEDRYFIAGSAIIGVAVLSSLLSRVNEESGHSMGAATISSFQN